MNFSIRRWLKEHYIDDRITEFNRSQIAAIAFRIIQDMELKSLTTFDICTLAEVLALPLAVAYVEIPVFVRLTQSFAEGISQNKPLTRNEGTWLAFQIAYLQALSQVLAQEKELPRLWWERALVRKDSKTLPLWGMLGDSQLRGLLKTLSPGKLSDTQAEQALSQVGDSLLVQQMNLAAVAWFVANCAEVAEATLITGRLVNSLRGHLLEAIANHAACFAQLQKFVGLGNASKLAQSSTSDDIDLHREHYRASLISQMSQPLLMESFSLQDIYVPPKGLQHDDGQILDLFTWAEQQLSDLRTVGVIESEPGYGKTSFCQIWASRIAQDLYPQWMPILLDLGDVKYGQTFTQTLNWAFQNNSKGDLSTWLAGQLQYVLILDGWDRLPPLNQNREQWLFVTQMIEFVSAARHKVLLTTRSKTLQNIAAENFLPLQRITIRPMAQEELKQWFEKWTKVQSIPVAQNFFNFCKQSGIFSVQSGIPLSQLVRQPLMLYLLGILHRDGWLDNQILQLPADTQDDHITSVLWEIYHRVNSWLLGYPQPGGTKTVLRRGGNAHIYRTPEVVESLLQNRHPQDLSAQMQSVALQIMRSHHEKLADVTLLDPPDNLPRFYFRTVTRRDSAASIEFSQHNLGVFLCSQAIVKELKALIQGDYDAYGSFNYAIPTPNRVAYHVYHLFGSGVLSQELSALVVIGLRREQGFSQSLCQRLLPFWYAYCRGRWLDEAIAHQVQPHFHKLHNLINVEQINASVGINVFLLLCSCHQEAQSTFFPCGDPGQLAEFYPEALMNLIARTAILFPNNQYFITKSLAFLNLRQAYLANVILANANFTGADLSYANLKGANLTNVNFTNANLTGANLKGANLSDANLSYANFSNSNLTNANLTQADIKNVNLSNACLSQAILADTDKENALLKGAIFDPQKFQHFNTQLRMHSHHDSECETTTQIWVENQPKMAS